jgi:hypothetical protein
LRQIIWCVIYFVLSEENVVVLIERVNMEKAKKLSLKGSENAEPCNEYNTRRAKKSIDKTQAKC